MILLAVVSVLAGAAWARTGRDPLWWTIQALIVLRASLGLSWRALRMAGEAWWHLLPSTIDRAREDVANG